MEIVCDPLCKSCDNSNGGVWACHSAVEKGAVIKKTVCRTADMINYIQFVLKFETEVVFDYLSGFPGLGMVNVDVDRRHFQCHVQSQWTAHL